MTLVGLSIIMVMKKKKGYAKGGVAKRGAGGPMKKKGSAKGGLMKMKRGGSVRKK